MRSSCSTAVTAHSGTDDRAPTAVLGYDGRVRGDIKGRVMSAFPRILAAAVAAGSVAAPLAAQYPYPQPYPQTYPYGQNYPYGYQQPYGGSVMDQVIGQLLGNRYNVTDRQAISRCANAAMVQAQNQYRGYAYNQG